MSVSYGKTIMNSQSGGAVFRILLLWEGSIYKLIYAELIVYILLYTMLSIIYRLVLSPMARQGFEKVVKFCYEKDRDIPLSFLLAFFVSGVLTRWWQMYMSLPWMHRLASFTQAFITGNEEETETARLIRFNIMRQVNLGWILGITEISQKLEHYFSGSSDVRPKRCQWRKPPRNRLPIGSFLTNVNASSEVRLHFGKLATSAEIEAMVETELDYQLKFGKPYCYEYWLPMQWATRICKKAMLHGYCDLRTMSILIDEIEQCRQKVHNLINYTNVLLPLVYTQVVIIAVYSYFLLQLFSQQFINARETAEALSQQFNRSFRPVHILEFGDDHDSDAYALDGRIDLYVPVFGIFRFLFLMGWMKVAMCLINPFGNDDEDFQIFDILGYNMEISARVAFSTYSSYPEPLITGSLAWADKQFGSQRDNLLGYLRQTTDDIGYSNASTWHIPQLYSMTEIIV